MLQRGDFDKKKWEAASGFECTQLLQSLYICVVHIYGSISLTRMYVNLCIKQVTCLLALVKRFVIIVLLREPAGIGRVAVGRRRPAVAALSQLPCTTSRREEIV